MNILLVGMAGCGWVWQGVQKLWLGVKRYVWVWLGVAGCAKIWQGVGGCGRV